MFMMQKYNIRTKKTIFEKKIKKITKTDNYRHN